MVNRDPKNILSAMRRHLQKGERITSVVPMSIGHSNETYRLEGAGSRPANAAVASGTRRAGPRYAGPVRVVCGIAWSPRRSAGTGGAIPVGRRGRARCAVLPDGGGQRRALQRMRSRAIAGCHRRQRPRGLHTTMVRGNRFRRPTTSARRPGGAAVHHCGA